MDPSSSTVSQLAQSNFGNQQRSRALSSASTCIDCSSDQPRQTHARGLCAHTCYPPESPQALNGSLANTGFSLTAQSSPRSAPTSLPSPPDSPTLDPYSDADLDSLSSFPSLSSSAFFSSGLGSSPHLHAQYQFQYTHSHTGIAFHHDVYSSQHGHEGHNDSIATSGFIIPSLSLPPALPQPTPYGQALGDVTFLLLGPAGAGTGSLAEYLIDTDDVVDVAAWETIPASKHTNTCTSQDGASRGTRVLHASTDWMEEHDAHGLERFEGSANVTFIELDSFDAAEKPDIVAADVLRHVHDVFNDTRSQLENSPSSPLLHSLLASSHSTLYTALIYVVTTPLTPQDVAIITEISASIPVIPFSTSASSYSTTFTQYKELKGKLAPFRPTSHTELQYGLFRSPQTLAALRTAAADRFMRWREVERTLSEPSSSNPPPLVPNSSSITKDDWNKRAWEASLSEDIARARRRGTVTSSNLPASEKSINNKSLLYHGSPCFMPTFDPLHLRSLMMLSFSFFLPRSLRRHAMQRASPSTEDDIDLKDTSVDPARSTSTIRPSRYRAGARKARSWRALRWGLAIVGVFCAGLGLGLALSGRA